MPVDNRVSRVEVDPGDGSVIEDTLRCRIEGTLLESVPIDHYLMVGAARKVVFRLDALREIEGGVPTRGTQPSGDLCKDKRIGGVHQRDAAIRELVRVGQEKSEAPE